jgi:hypothetical protein
MYDLMLCVSQNSATLEHFTQHTSHPKKYHEYHIQGSSQPSPSEARAAHAEPGGAYNTPMHYSFVDSGWDIQCGGGEGGGWVFLVEKGPHFAAGAANPGEQEQSSRSMGWRAHCIFLNIILSKRFNRSHPQFFYSDFSAGGTALPQGPQNPLQLGDQQEHLPQQGNDPEGML